MCGTQEQCFNEKYLKTIAKFHNYSANNCILIVMQKEDATRVASFTTWKNLNRNVKKGEKGIKIIAPAPYKKYKLMDCVDKNTGEVVIGADGKPIQEKVEVVVQNYKLATVFDISQTEGKELPEIVHELQGNKEDYEKMFTAIQIASPVPINFENIKTGANGYYSQVEKRIAVRDGMSQIQTIKTSIHEVSHAMLHNRDQFTKTGKLPDSFTREVQAESVAYVVCSHFNIDTSDYSFGYIAGWSKNKELPELKESMGVIRETAAQIINKIEKEMKRMNEKEQCMILAIEIDQYAQDFDFYDYEDKVVSKEAMIDSLMRDIEIGNVGYIKDWINSSIDTAATEQDIEKAKEILERIKKYDKKEIIKNNECDIKKMCRAM